LRIYFISSTRNKEHKPFFFENSQGDITDENGNEAMDWEEETDPFNLENLTIQASLGNTLLEYITGSLFYDFGHTDSQGVLSHNQILKYHYMYLE
jgi:hypothetical protein